MSRCKTDDTNDGDCIRTDAEMGKLLMRRRTHGDCSDGEDAGTVDVDIDIDIEIDIDIYVDIDMDIEIYIDVDVGVVPVRVREGFHVTGP